jgi:nitroreductase
MNESQAFAVSGSGKVLEDLILARRSVRGFRPDPLPAELIHHIFSVAQWSPSSCNIQPWIVHVVGGETAEAMRAALSQAVAEQRPLSPDLALTDKYFGVYRERQVDAAKRLFAVEGIAREDREGRARSYARNFRFFDAPHAAFIFRSEDQGIREAADCGMYAQTLMLAMAACGVGSCPQGSLSHHAAVVRSVLGIPEQHRLLFGIAFGWEDPSHPANTVRVGRADPASSVTFRL